MCVVIGVLLMSSCAPALAQSSCRQGISPEMATRLFGRLNQPPAEPDCKFEGVQTEHSTLHATWSYGTELLPPIVVVPQECATSPTARRAGPFAIEIPVEIAQRCPSVADLFASFEEQVAVEMPAGRLGSVDDPLFRGARVLFMVLGFVVLALLLRAAMRRPAIDTQWVGLGAIGFGAALLLRGVLPFTLGNWYSEVLPLNGPPPLMRFGPGFFALHSLLRDAGGWSAGTLRWSQLLLGAAAAPLLVAVLYELRADVTTVAAALVLLVLAPFHARLSATTSEHVLASTLCLGLLLSWLRAERSGDLLWFAVALLLFPAVCATRIDMSLQAALVLPWPLFRDRIERPRGQRIRWLMLAIFAIFAGTTLLAAYYLIALPSKHPLPDTTWFRFALWTAVPQFWWLSTTAPGWISLSSVLLAIIGAPVVLARRPLLFVRVIATIFLAFVFSGRSFMHDELVGARYFLFIIPLFLILSGCGFGALTPLIPRALRPIAVPIALSALALWAGVDARSAYAARYTFQDEYSFVRAALAQLPANCVVYQQRIRDDALPGDLDCCLDLPRSPIGLERPSLKFVDLPDDLAAIAGAAPCVAYYEGAACAITPAAERAEHAFIAHAAAHFQPRCAAVHAQGHLELVAETTAAPRSTRGIFGDEPPRVRLYGWTP